LKDFPREILQKYDIDVQHPDVFISNLIDLNSKVVKRAFIKQVSRLKNPPQSIGEVLNTFRKIELIESARKLSNLFDCAIMF